jgi:16S rRNA (guanine527-N7)-methyltransferase
LDVSREITGLGPLAERYGLTERQVGQLGAILEELAADELAPTTVRDPAQAVDVHIADSLVALEMPALARAAPALPGPAARGAARALTDLGAGAGFPGLALAVALPESELALVESQTRKCAFLKRVLAAAEIGNARVVHARAEEWREGLGGSDVVTARALAPPPVVLEYAASLLRLDGVLVDWRGQRDVAEEAAAVLAAGELGLRLIEIRHVEPYEGARNHHLHVYEKARETPVRYPRRAGVARKHPLGC